MKVPTSPPLSAARPVSASAPVAPHAEPSAPSDPVSVDQSEHLGRVVSEARAQQADARRARVAEVAAQVQAGTYRPDPGQLAQALLGEVHIDRQLHAALQAAPHET
jgi:flagellar biosynthesis anti-sigma factor FlgM